MQIGKYKIYTDYNQWASQFNYEATLAYIKEETECFIYDSSEMHEYIRYEDGEEVSENISSAQDLYKWAEKYFNKCHVMLIEKYSHGGDAFYAVEVDTTPTCRWDSGIVGIIAVPKKRFRNTTKTKDFMRNLVQQFSNANNESMYDLTVLNTVTGIETRYSEIDSDIEYDIRHAKTEEELEKILSTLDIIDEYATDEAI